MRFPMKTDQKCGICGRAVPYVKVDGVRTIDPTVIYSSRTGNHYCPSRLYDECLQVAKKTRSTCA